MKCQHCSAPLEVVTGRNYFFCAYCTSFHFPTDLGTSEDSVTSLGPQFELACPKCSLHLSNGAVEGVAVHYCQKCRGLLVPNDVFADIVRARRAKHEGPPTKPALLNRDELEREITCPNCEHTMDTHPYYGPGAVVIDSCGRCKLVWLDHGELGAIQSAPGRR